MSYEQDNSGILSLGGFAFQIKVFVYYLSKLTKESQIEFETIDDVSIKNFKHQDIDDESEHFITKIIETDSYEAIQVKRTKITDTSALQIIWNWMLIEESDINVSQYTLYTDEDYGNVDIIFNNSPRDIFDKMNKSNKKKNASITRVKMLFNNDFAKFESTYYSIKNKHKLVSRNNIDEDISDAYSLHFRKTTSNEVVYFQRLGELLQHITSQILDSVLAKKPYKINYYEYLDLIEDITNRFTPEVTEPNYSDFKAINKVDINEIESLNPREYMQLISCALPQNLIINYLTQKFFYEHVRLNYMYNNKKSKIKDIEETAFENFESVKFNLQRQNKDLPFNRFQETISMSNSYVSSDQTRHGSAIYLTKDDIGEQQISWEDDDNAKS